MNPNFKPELIRKAAYIVERSGIEGLAKFQSFNGACGCMGPQNGDRLCPCAQSSMLEANLVEILGEFDEDRAKKLMLGRIVDALPG